MFIKEHYCTERWKVKKGHQACASFRFSNFLWTLHAQSPRVEFRWLLGQPTLRVPGTTRSLWLFWLVSCIVDHCTWIRWMASPKALVTLGSAPCLVRTKECGQFLTSADATWCALPKPLPQEQQNNTCNGAGSVREGCGITIDGPQRHLFVSQIYKIAAARKVTIIIRNDPVWDDSNMTHLLASSCRDHPSTQQPGSPLRTPSCNGVCPWPRSASQHEAYEMEQLSNFQTLTCAVESTLTI